MKKLTGQDDECKCGNGEKCCSKKDPKKKGSCDGNCHHNNNKIKPKKTKKIKR